MQFFGPQNESLAEWFNESELMGRRPPQYQKYLNLFGFLGLVLLIFTVHHVEPVVHAIEKSLPVVKHEVNLTNELFIGLRHLKGIEIRTIENHFELEVPVGNAFFPGRAELSEFAEKDFRTLAGQIAALIGDKSLTVLSYTDDSPVIKNRHLYSDNFVLTKARADAVADIFRSHGFSIIETQGMGDKDPRYINRDPAGEAISHNQILNRRIIIRFHR